jgi:valyl-tRNA synthetase
MRFALARSAVPGQDTNIAEEWIEGDRRFCNKLWNAARFVLYHLGDDAPDRTRRGLSLPDRWILSRLAATQAAVDDAIDEFDFAKASRALYEFIWSELCDWYVEMAKLPLRSPDTAPQTQAVLYEALEGALRMAHPIMPFITEELWQQLPRRPDDAESIAIAEWPSDLGEIDVEAERDMAHLQSLVVEMRRFRHEKRIPPRQPVDVNVVTEHPQLIAAHAEQLKTLAALGDVRINEAFPGAGWSKLVTIGAEVHLALPQTLDIGAERQRLEREIAEHEALAHRARAKLDNPKFVSGAPADVVDKTRSQLSEHTQRVELLRAQLEELGS